MVFLKTLDWGSWESWGSAWAGFAVWSRTSFGAQSGQSSVTVLFFSDIFLVFACWKYLSYFVSFGFFWNSSIFVQIRHMLSCSCPCDARRSCCQPFDAFPQRKITCVFLLSADLKVMLSSSTIFYQILPVLLMHSLSSGLRYWRRHTMKPWLPMLLATGRRNIELRRVASTRVQLISCWRKDASCRIQ